MSTIRPRSILRASLCAIFLTALACALQSRRQDLSGAAARKPANFYYNSYDVDNSFNFHCADLFKLLNGRKRIATIEKLLQEIRSVRPNYLSQHTFAYSSRSMHESSFENPRAIVYGGDAKLVLTFNGAPEQGGYERLEIMCFREPAKKFEFFEVTFPREASKGTDLSELSDRQRNLASVISPVNGFPTRRCTTCHQSPARPNWDTYSLWPGFYGGNDDGRRVGNSFQELHYQDLKQVESEKWDLFVQNQRRKGRYGQLPERINPAAEGANALFGARLSILNGERIVAELVAKGRVFSDIQFRFAQPLFCDVPFWGAAVNQEVDAILKSTLERDPVFASIQAENLEYEKSKMDVVRFIFKDTGIGPGAMNVYSSPADAWLSAQLKRVLGPLGVDVHNWSLVLNGGYSFGDGLHEPAVSMFTMKNMLSEPFARDFWQKREPEIYSAFRESVDVEGDADYSASKRARVCDLIKARLH